MPRVADESGLRVRGSHLPPGTRTWPTSEHRLCCHLTAHWRGKPLASREVVISLLGATTTTKGRRIQTVLDAGQYPTGVNVSAVEMTALPIQRAEFPGDWNDTILPH